MTAHVSGKRPDAVRIRPVRCIAVLAGNEPAQALYDRRGYRPHLVSVRKLILPAVHGDDRRRP